ncbi:MAG: serine/threonine protein kinase [Acidobacteria bacterium]|nr:serine/threonine protein kinase [Acidobacteriota bacterium]
MELLDGEELRVQLGQGALPVRKAIEYAQQIAAGLAAAHEKGIVHRDLKPENLFVTKDGRVKILDFGMAKLKPHKLTGGVDSEAETMKPLTNPGVVMGTVGYMSPEQVRGAEVDHRSDIFSFGIILHEMLSGQRTFAGDSLVELMNAILKEDPPELSETNAKIPTALAKLVRRCLEKKPERRFHSAHDLGFALETLSSAGYARVLAGNSGQEASSIPMGDLQGQHAGTRAYPGRVWMIMSVVLLLGLLLALPFAVKYLRLSPPAAPVAARFTIAAPEKATVSSRQRFPRWPPSGFRCGRRRQEQSLAASAGFAHGATAAQHGGRFRHPFLVTGQPLNWFRFLRDRTQETRSRGRCVTNSVQVTGRRHGE